MTATILRTLDDARDSRHNAGAFCKLARLLTASRGNLVETIELAQVTRTKPFITEIVRSAVTGGNLGDWSAIADYQVISTAFSESLRSLGVFDAMLPSIVPAPLRSRGITVTTGISGASPSERSIKPISSLALGNALVEPRKSTAVLVVTEEVAKSGDANINALFDSELRKGVVAATDTTFLSALIAATTPTASAGATYANVVTDFKVLFNAVTTHANSKLFYIISPARMKSLMFLTSNQGAPVLSLLQAAGQALSVVPIASDQIAADAALLVDASGVAGSADIIVLDATSQSVVQMDTAPDSPPVAATAMLSLFQSNHRALRAERFYGFTVLRANAVASLSGVAY